jgi:hypothetical protein
MYAIRRKDDTEDVLKKRGWNCLIGVRRSEERRVETFLNPSLS